VFELSLRNCARCGKVFASTGGGLCPDCSAEEEKDFVEVRDYLRGNPRATVAEIHEETGVREELILKFIREGRLVSLRAENLEIPCVVCGALITKGRVCAQCSESISGTVQQLRDEGTGSGTRRGPRMYTEDYLKRKKRTN